MSETQKITFTGASTIQSDLEIDDHVVFMVSGRVKKRGIDSTASQGHVEFRAIQIDGIVALSGVEQMEAAQRVADEMNANDAEVIKAVTD